ncbi:Ints6 [Acrasis kona]|uniref:Ints6 n=1 Tax=Acrasis kona TaxID=1008807 RepID=A0AAW2YU93_9EUKA
MRHIISLFLVAVTLFMAVQAKHGHHHKPHIGHLSHHHHHHHGCLHHIKKHVIKHRLKNVIKFMKIAKKSTTSGCAKCPKARRYSKKALKHARKLARYAFALSRRNICHHMRHKIRSHAKKVVRKAKLVMKAVHKCCHKCVKGFSHVHFRKHGHKKGFDITYAFDSSDIDNFYTALREVEQAAFQVKSAKWKMWKMGYDVFERVVKNSVHRARRAILKLPKRYHKLGMRVVHKIKLLSRW